MASFKENDKVTHPRVSGELTVISTRLVDGMLTADDGGNFSVADSERNFTLVQPPIRFGDRVRYADAVHFVIGTLEQGVYRIGYELNASYPLTEAEVLKLRVLE